MSHILIIGYGNPLRCDDGFGWHLGQRLQTEIQNSDIEIVACHQLTPDLAQRISGAQYVIFADATAEPVAAECSLQKLRTNQVASPDFSHHLDPQTLLVMAHTLYGASPCAAFLLTAKAHELGYGQEFSPQMERTLDKARARVLSLCEFLEPSAHLVSLPFVTQYA